MILYFLKIHLNYFVICGNKKDLIFANLI